MVVLGIFLIACLLVGLFMFVAMFTCCWNDSLWSWQFSFGDALGEVLYNFNINTNKAWNNFWKYFWK